MLQIYTEPLNQLRKSAEYTRREASTGFCFSETFFIMGRGTKVIGILSELSDSIMAVRGNCEAEVDQMVLPFPVLSESALVFADGLSIFLTQGHIWTEEKHPGGIDAFFSGHTHIPVLKNENGLIILNPGSTSIPKGGFDPSYAVYDDGDIDVISLRTGERMMYLGR